MASVSDFRKGMVIEFNQDLYIVTDFQHITPGKGQAVTRTKLKNVVTGRVIENSFRGTDKLTDVRLEERKLQYLYSDADNLYLQDLSTYDQLQVSKDMLGERIQFLKEGNEVSIKFHDEKPVLADLPITVELKVTEAYPVARGNTAGNLTNEVTLETGAAIQVPPFIKEGDVIKIDTRTGSYLSRA